VAAGQLGDHVEADAGALEQFPHADVGRLLQQGIEPVVFQLRHAKAAVIDLDDQARGDGLGAHHHPGLGRRERRRVLHQLGQQVDDVRHREAVERAGGARDDLDPRVVERLGDGRAQDLHHRDRLGPLAPRHRPAEHGEVLRVPAHPGGQVVDPEQALEQVGLFHLVLQRVEQLDLPVHQGLEPVREVDEHAPVGGGRRGSGRGGRRRDGRRGGHRGRERRRSADRIGGGAVRRAGHPGRPDESDHDDEEQQGSEH
jgi:hypothetical protein